MEYPLRKGFIKPSQGAHHHMTQSIGEQVTKFVSEGWTEKKEPELFKFEAEGQMINGFLLGRIEEQAEGKPVPTYIIELDSHELIKIRGTHDLIKKLTPADKGKRVRIIYEGTEQVTNGKMMKFRVLTKPGRDARNNPEISDDDLPDVHALNGAFSRFGLLWACDESRPDFFGRLLEKEMS
jgi:hypothetical protein